MEKFIDIKGYEGRYQASSLGNIRSLLSSKNLKPATHKKGYLYVSLVGENGKTKSFRVHQLVAMAFLGHEPCGMKVVVDHINHDKTDNRLDNLRLVDNRTNSNNRRNAGSSKYTGVSIARNNKYKKWQSKIQVSGKRIHLGYFRTQEEAHNAYQQKLMEL